MKIRVGFVSNSSSSSYVVIGHGPLEFVDFSEIPEGHGGVLVVDGKMGETEFGWGPSDEISCVWSKIHFAYLQTVYAKNDEWREMIENILEEHCGINKVEWKISPYGGWVSDDPEPEEAYAYIDHQSSALEGENTEMFDTCEQLERFLFCKDSYIRLDNDNGY